MLRRGRSWRLLGHAGNPRKAASYKAARTRRYARQGPGFYPLPMLVDSTRRNSLIRWQKHAAVWEHGFESRWGHQIVFVDV